MRIKEITIKNFKSYMGETTLNLDIKDDNNVILIGGQNGAGKSSLFEAVKICIYGPLAYGYQGMVSNYIHNIRKSINDQIYSSENVESFIELKLYLIVDGKEELYTIKRRWTFNKSVLVEDFLVHLGEREIIGEEKDRFETYLNNLIPPSVFDLFLFDGEKLFEFFNDSNMEKKLKDVMLTLNNLDILTFLSRELELNNRRNIRDMKELESDVEEITGLEKELEEKQNKYERQVSRIDAIEIENEDLNLRIEMLSEEFLKAGGLLEEERDTLISSMRELELRRDDINQAIKDYSNEVLPFLIVKDNLGKVKEQVHLEDEYQSYAVLKSSLNKASIDKALEENNIDVSSKISDKLVESILSNIGKKSFKRILEEDFREIHKLSASQRDRILRKIEEIENEDRNRIKFFDDKDKIGEELAGIRKILRSSLDSQDEIRFIKDKERLEKNKLDLEIETVNLENKIERLEVDIEKLERELFRKNEQLTTVTRGNRVNSMSNEIIEFTEDLVKKITRTKILEIESQFNYIFDQIIRKKEFIDHIKISPDFKITIYSKTEYKAIDICRIVSNLSLDEISDKYGSEFLKEITNNEPYMTTDKIFRRYEKEIENKTTYMLSKKIDVDNLSSGEKQVYILSLYWALIKTSKIKIPFIIDTPYGRIDDIHRDAITTKFFPRISDQVVILSTKTEVNEELYKKIKEFVAREYILDYNVQGRYTQVKDGYFFEVI